MFTRAPRVLVLLALTVGCGGGGGTAPGPGPGPGPGPDPDPLLVASITDDARAVTAEIPASGGSATVTGADGTVYLLTIPDGALLDDATLTLTPITSVTGLPFAAGLLGAVQIAPIDLEFYQQARLTITLPAPTAIAQVHGFAVIATPPSGARSGSAGTSGEFGVTPVEVVLDPGNPGETTIIDLLINDGGDYGGGSGDPGPSHPPTRDGDQRRGEVGDILEGGQDPNDPATQAELDALFDRDWPAVKQGLTDAETDAGKLREAMRDFLEWWRDGDRLGLDDAENRARIEEGLNSLAKGFANALDAAAQRCSETSDPAVAIEMLRMAKQIAILGLEGRAPGTSDAEVLAKVRQCARFELFIDESFDTTAEGQTYGARRQATVIITPDDAFVLTGSAPWQFVSGFFPQEDCCLLTVRESQTATVHVQKAIPPVQAGMLKHEWKVLIDINEGSTDTPKEELHVDCGSCDPPGPEMGVPRTLWLPAWEAHYLPQRVEPLDAWAINDWEPGDALILARRTQGDTVTIAATYAETATWEIRHVPQSGS